MTCTTAGHLSRRVRHAPIGLALLALSACGPKIESAGPRPSSSRSNAALTGPQIMRGTVSSEATIVGYASIDTPGYQPLVAQGYGLVVGLNGTGSRDIGPDLRAHMIAEMTRGGIGSERYNMGHLSPTAMLDSMDTAVVVVQGVVPQAATTGTRFDVRVTPAPGSSTTSLEGGILYTTQLRPDLEIGRPSSDSFPIAKARGPIFINPFAQPGDEGATPANRTVGRIMNGGSVLDDLPLKLRLFNPSHARAGMVVTAINTRFPQEPGQRDPTARGESDESIVLTIPPSFEDRIGEFVDLVLHTTLRQANPESIAMSIRRILLANPTRNVAEAASLRWQALGTRVLPIIRDLYDHPEERPRGAALVAGAKLGDPLAVPNLIEQTKTGSLAERLQAIMLLRPMGLDPNVDQALRALLNDPNTTIRLEAYEALAARGDPTIRHITVDEKFLVDVVESDAEPIVYVTEIGMPRIALIGADLSIARPVTFMTWSNRLMLMADSGDEDVEVYFRPVDAAEGFTTLVEPELDEFVRFLGHTTTVEKPDPGLGLSYGETVGLLYQICSSEYVKADFKAQQDRVQAAIAAIQEEQTIVDRPEFIESDTDRFLPAPEAPAGSGQDGKGSGPAQATSGRR